MELKELQTQIKNKEFDHLYIFTGEEIAIQKIYINKIATELNLEVEYANSFKDIFGRLDSNNLFNIKKLYVVVEDTELIKEEKAWQTLLYDNLGENYLILKYSTIDKRSKFYKNFESKIVEFNKLSNDVLIKYIQKEVPGLLEANCEKLIYICDNNYNRILLELDKIKNYDIYNDHNYNTYFLALDLQGAFHQEVKDTTFEFIDMVLKRNVTGVAKLRDLLLRDGESCLGILSLLYNNLKTILLIQSCKTDDICRTTGLQYYQVKYNKEKTGYYSNIELVNALRIIQKVESGIKRGTIEEQIALDYILVNII